MEKLHLQPLLPKVKKKKKKMRRKRSKKEEEWVSTWPEHIPRINFYPNRHKFMEDGELDCIHYYLNVKSVGTIEDDFDYDMCKARYAVLFQIRTFPPEPEDEA